MTIVWYCARFSNPYIKRKFPPERVVLGALLLSRILCFGFRLQKLSCFDVQSAVGCKIYLLEGFWIFVGSYPKYVIIRNNAFCFSCAEKLLVICLISCQVFKILNWKSRTSLSSSVVPVGKRILNSAVFVAFPWNIIHSFFSWFNSSNNIDRLLLFFLFP